MTATVLAAFGFTENNCSLIPFGSGLINNTWRLTHNQQEYILQRINEQVFRSPVSIADNMKAIGDYVEKTAPSYFFVQPVKTVSGQTWFHDPRHGYFRLFPFVKGSHTIDVVSNPGEAFEAAVQFGRFTRMSGKFDTSLLQTTLPGFHNLDLRYRQFRQAAVSAVPERLQKSKDLADFLENQYHLVETYNYIRSNPEFKTRVTHHDTKISNVLFDKNDKGICVIDLDTVMPGYFISDAGDMMRTYLSPVSEEEKDIRRIEIREDYFQAIVKGYLSEMKDELTVTEKKHFVYAGKFMTYMQSLRFLTDYLDNDVYYGSKYEDHNLIRAANQAALLERMIEKENALQDIVLEICSSVVE